MPSHSTSARWHAVEALHRLAETIRLGLCRLNQLQFDAPWNTRRHGC
jgi:hypothetical protein